MKLFMIRKIDSQGKYRYRSAGMYDSWSSRGKCWASIQTFKSFLNYDRKCALNQLMKSFCDFPIDIIEIDVDNATVTTHDLMIWLHDNMKIELESYT